MKYFVGMTERAACSHQCAVTQARAGLKAFADQFDFIDASGSRTPLHDAARAAVMGGSTTLGSITIQGQSSELPPSLSLPYDKKLLEGSAAIAQMETWVSKGVVEASAGEAIKQLCSNKAQSVDLRGMNFCLLGAGSAMGPAEALLRQGATVYAVDIPRRPKLWARLIAMARKSPGGSLVVPVMGEVSVEDALAGGDASIAAAAGCDLLTDAPNVAAWCASCAPGKKLTLGTYVYLDGALFARVAAASDAIVAAVTELRGGVHQAAGVSLAQLLSPTEVHVVPQVARDAAAERYGQWSLSSLWKDPVRIISKERFLKPNLAMPVPQGDEDKTPLYVQDGLVSMQGPNYALAKTLQKWRAIIARENGHLVSATVGPSTLTQSVTHNRLIAAGLLGSRYFGVEPFAVPTASALLAYILMWDLSSSPGEGFAHPETPLRNPLEMFAQNSCHGGLWRAPYTTNSSTEVSVVLHGLGLSSKYLVGAGVVAAAALAQRPRSKL